MKVRATGNLIAETTALRTGVAIVPSDHVARLRVDGDRAFAALDRLSTAPLYLREGQIRQTLFLDETARPIADVVIASDETGYYVFAEGLTAASLAALITMDGTADLEVTNLCDTHDAIALHGPRAWEVVSALLGPAVLGMPFLSFLNAKDVICFRVGGSGEFGYQLLVPRPRAAGLRARIEEAGVGKGLATIGLSTLDQAALESGVFNIRDFNLRTLHEGLSVTPIELQLQWRVTYDRGFVGAEALRARRAAGISRRTTTFTAAAPVAIGDRVFWSGRSIGEVMAFGWSPERGDFVGLALLDIAVAHPGIDAFVVEATTGAVPIVTRSPPLVASRSLKVDLAAHAANAFPNAAPPPAGEAPEWE